MLRRSPPLWAKQAELSWAWGLRVRAQRAALGPAGAAVAMLITAFCLLAETLSSNAGGTWVCAVPLLLQGWLALC